MRDGGGRKTTGRRRRKGKKEEREVEIGDNLSYKCYEDEGDKKES